VADTLDAFLILGADTFRLGRFAVFVLEEEGLIAKLYIVS